MRTLYILNNPNLVKQCQAAMTDTDALLLIEDAVQLATKSVNRALNHTVNDKHSFVLQEDLIARGLQATNDWIQKDYEGFVELTLNFDKTVSWL